MRHSRLLLSPYYGLLAKGVQDILKCADTKVDTQMNAFLCEYSREEVKDALDVMGDLKRLGHYSTKSVGEKVM